MKSDAKPKAEAAARPFSKYLGDVLRVVHHINTPFPSSSIIATVLTRNTIF